MTQTEDNLLEIRDLSVHFHGDGPPARAVDGIDIRIGRKETVCVVGESGCGKTVTALAVLGLLQQPPARIESGRIMFNGENLLSLPPSGYRRIRGRQIAMVFQEPMTSLNPVFTIGDQITESLVTHMGQSPQDAQHNAVALLDAVGIKDPGMRIGSYPHELSGGQRQRVMIAMALACRPQLLIADEPTTALDVTVQAQILLLLKTLKEDGNMALQYITHDLGVVSAIADRIYVMYAGIVVEEGRRKDIFNAPAHPYTRALLDALPTKTKRGQRLYSIPGNVPHPAYKPAGCPFHPRCPYRQLSCETQFPALCRYESGHGARCPVLFETGARDRGGSQG